MIDSPKNVLSTGLRALPSSPLNLHRGNPQSPAPQLTDIKNASSNPLSQMPPGNPSPGGNQPRDLLERADRLLHTRPPQAMTDTAPEAQDVVITIERLINEPDNPMAGAQPGTAAYALARDAASFLAERQADQGGKPLSQQDRTCAMLDWSGSRLRMVANNEFKGDLGRWLANAANVGVRTGLIVGLTTTVRQLIGFTIEKAATLDSLSDFGRQASGAAAMLLGPGLNVAGFVRDEINHTATPQSRASRIAMASLSMGALSAATMIGASSVLGSLMSSFGPQVASYCLSRDLIQMFFPLRDNAPINLAGTLTAAGLYSSVQMAAGESMDALAPNSGAGYVRTVAASVTDMTPDSIRQSVDDAIRALQPVFGEDVVRGMLNAGAEISDDLLRPAVSRAIEVRQLLKTVTEQAIAEGRDPAAAIAALPRAATEGLRVSTGARIPTCTEIGNQLLTTSAMRTSGFEAIMGIAMSTATALGTTNLSGANQGHVINAVVAGALALVYPPFLYAHDQREPSSTSALPSHSEPGVQLSSAHPISIVTA